MGVLIEVEIIGLVFVRDELMLGFLVSGNVNEVGSFNIGVIFEGIGLIGGGFEIEIGL